MDPLQMLEVLLNLIINAEQAIEESGQGGRLVVGTFVSDDKVRLTLEDNGPGMPPDVASDIFDPFFTTKDVGQGTGLGLSICYGIVKKHEGQIWVESKPNEGTVFHVELPISGPPLPLQAETTSPSPKRQHNDR